jgi:hypothetical protein
VLAIDGPTNNQQKLEAESPTCKREAVGFIDTDGKRSINAGFALLAKLLFGERNTCARYSFNFDLQRTKGMLDSKNQQNRRVILSGSANIGCGGFNSTDLPKESARQRH